MEVRPPQTNLHKLIRDDAIMGDRETVKRVIPLFAILFVSILIFLAAGSGKQKVKKQPIPAAAVSFAAPPVLSAPLEISAHAYVVRFFGDEQLILKRREWKPFPPASLTKILTALLAREKLSPDEWVSFSAASKNTEEKRSNAVVGEMFLRDDAIRVALINSANDAALALAEAVEKKEQGAGVRERAAFSTLMNEKAKEIGMSHSHFTNPTGLHEDAHYSTAEDLSLLAEYVWRYDPDVWEITRTAEITVVSSRSRTHFLHSTNDLLQEFSAVAGGKTGFLEHTKGSLLLLYPVSVGRMAVVVLLGSDDRFGDGRKIIAWLEENFPWSRQ